MVGQSSRLANQANTTSLRDVPRDDPRVGFSRTDQAWAVRTNHPRRSCILRILEKLGRVRDGNAFGDDDNQRHARINSFDDGALGKARRNKDHRNVGASGSHCIANGVEDGNPVDLLTTLAGGHTSNDLGTGFDHAAGVLGAFTTGDALNQDLAVFRNKDCHCLQVPYFAAS